MTLVDAASHQMVEGQLRHVALLAAPVAVEYVPARHGAVSRVPPPQYQPAGQMVVPIVAPSGQKYEAAHAVQVEREVAPVPPQ